MGLHITPDIEQMAARLAQITGHSAEEEVLAALRERAQHLNTDKGLPKTDKPLRDRIEEIQRYYAYPLLDERAPNEIIGYNAHGHFDETWSDEQAEDLLKKISKIQERSAQHPIIDPRSPDEILYDENGLPK